MSNIDNHFSSERNNIPIDYRKKESYTTRVQRFLEEYDSLIPDIIKEYDDLEERIVTKDCKAFREKMDGLAALKDFHDGDYFKNMLYWYVEQPKQSVGA